MRKLSIILSKNGPHNEWVIKEDGEEIAVFADKEDAYFFYNNINRPAVVPADVVGLVDKAAALLEQAEQTRRWSEIIKENEHLRSENRRLEDLRVKVAKEDCATIMGLIEENRKIATLTQEPR